MGPVFASMFDVPRVAVASRRKSTIRAYHGIFIATLPSPGVIESLASFLCTYHAEEIFC